MADVNTADKRKRRTPSNSGPSGPSKYYCDTCKVHCPNDQTLVQHNKGKKHTQAVSKVLKREQHTLSSIFVGNLPKAAKLATPEEKASNVVQPEKLKTGLMEIFSKFGEVSKMVIDKNHAHFCIIEYKTPSMANAALSAFKLGQVPVFYDSKLKVKSRNQTEVKPVGDISLPNELQQDNIIALLEEAEEAEFGLALVDSALALTEAMQQGRLDTCNRLKTQIQQNLPFYKISLELYGSSGSGLAMADSDLDLSISIMDGKRLQREDLVMILKQKCIGVSHVHVIPGPCGKIIRFLDGVSNTMCDILFANKLGLANTELVRVILSTDKRVARLVRLVNFWCRTNISSKFPKSKCLSSYALTVMVVRYLIEVECVPVMFGAEGNKYETNFIFDLDCSFTKDVNLLPKQSNTQSIADLMKGFFAYYGSTFEAENHVVHIRSKEKLPRTSFSANPDQEMSEAEGSKNYVTVFKLTPLCVQDPLVLTHNIAHNVTEDVLVLFVDCCRDGVKKMEEGVELGMWLFSGGVKKEEWRKKKDSGMSVDTDRDGSMVSVEDSTEPSYNGESKVSPLPGMKRGIEELGIGS